MNMSYSTLSNVPITLGQKTPDVLRKSNRLRNDESYASYNPREDFNSYNPRRSSDQRNFASQRLSQDTPFYANQTAGDGLSSYTRAEYQTRNAANQQQYDSSSFVRGYEPLQKSSTTQFTNLYPTSGFDSYIPPSPLLEKIINISQYINGAIVFVATFIFLYLNLSLINFWMKKAEFTFTSFEFIKILLLLIVLLFSKGLMLRHYDEFINWTDILKRLFTKLSFLQLALFINFITMIAFTFDIFAFLNREFNSEGEPIVSSDEISQIMITSIINSFLSGIRSLSSKHYLLETASFETNYSYLSVYSPRSLFSAAIKLVRLSVKVNIFSIILCYSGFASLLLGEAFPEFAYENMSFPGFFAALERFSKDFVIVWCANFIIEVQTKLLKKVWTRVLQAIGSTKFSTQPLYYFNDTQPGDEVLTSHCLRFLDTFTRFECRNSLLRKQNPTDAESKTFYHVLIESTLDKLDKINVELQKLKASSLVVTGSISRRSYRDNILIQIEQFFSSQPDLHALRRLYFEINKATHQFKVVNRVFREMKILNLDVILRNFTSNFQSYYQGLYTTLLALNQIKKINRSFYVNSFLTNINSFEEVIKEGLLMLNKFVATR